MWYCVVIILAFGRLRQEDHQEFEVSLGYRMKLCVKTQTEKKKGTTFMNLEGIPSERIQT